jgi:hypothetical protein
MQAPSGALDMTKAPANAANWLGLLFWRLAFLGRAAAAPEVGH